MTFRPLELIYGPLMDFPGAQMVKNLPAMPDTWVQSLGQEDPLEKGMATYSSILAWKFHGQGSLMDYSPWGRKESDATNTFTSLF